MGRPRTSVRTDAECINVHTRDEELELKIISPGKWQAAVRTLDGWSCMHVDRTDLLMLHEWIFKQIYQPKNVIEETIK